MMMKPVPVVKLLIAAMFAAILSLAGHPAGAEDALKQPWMPMPAKAVDGKCDADPAWMRKWHMKVLMHKRDDTMHEGIRTDQFSLKRCITCHAVKDDAGKFVTVRDERHFCRTCHDYAAVQVDCFDCHASRPEAGAPGHADAAGSSSVAVLQQHFGGEGK